MWINNFFYLFKVTPSKTKKQSLYWEKLKENSSKVARTLWYVIWWYVTSVLCRTEVQLLNAVSGAILHWPIVKPSTSVDRQLFCCAEDEKRYTGREVVLPRVGLKWLPLLLVCGALIEIPVFRWGVMVKHPCHSEEPMLFMGDEESHETLRVFWRSFAIAQDDSRKCSGRQ